MRGRERVRRGMEKEQKGKGKETEGEGKGRMMDTKTSNDESENAGTWDRRCWSGSLATRGESARDLINHGIRGSSRKKLCTITKT